MSLPQKEKVLKLTFGYAQWHLDYYITIKRNSNFSSFQFTLGP